MESSVSDGEDVRRDFVTPPAVVDLHGAGGVDGVTLVRVDSDAEETGVGLPESNGQSREEQTDGENHQIAESFCDDNKRVDRATQQVVLLLIIFVKGIISKQNPKHSHQQQTAFSK